MKFKDLDIGDVFNTKRGRYAKIENDKALVIFD